jgi:tyrosyl-tRNA synthetase
MSKSYNNYIALNDSPKEIFGKIMSISDNIMFKYYELLTQVDLNSIKNMHPKEAKSALACNIVETYYGKEESLSAKNEFEKIFAKKDIPEDIEVYEMPDEETKLSELLVKSSMVSSKNEARRLIEQGGVKIDGQKAEDDLVIKMANNFILKAGKRKFKKIIPGGWLKKNS